MQADSAMRVPTVTVGIKDAYAGFDTAQIYYNKTDSNLKVYTGSQWIDAIRGSGSSGWLLTGNSGTTAGTNFLGTTDAQDLVFKRNSSEAMRIYSSNKFVGINTATPITTLEVKNGGLFVGNFDGTSTIDILENSAAIIGTATDAKLTATGQGALVVGFSQDNDAEVSVTGSGSLAVGWANDGSKILNSGNGSFVGGNAQHGFIRTQSDGSFTWGGLSGSGGQDTVDNTGVNSFVVGVTGNSSAKNLFNSGSRNFVFGSGYTNSTDDIFSVGFGSQQFLIDGTGVGIGTTSPSTKLHIDGAAGFRYVDGFQGVGKVLMDDGAGNGVAKWQTPSTVATAVPLSGLTAATGSNTIDNTTHLQTWNWSGAVQGALLLGRTTTTAAASGYMLGISMSGTHSTAGRSSFGIDITNAHTGATSTNYGLRLNVSGATVNNAIDITAGALALNGSAGTSGQVLTSTGTSSIPIWSSAPTITLPISSLTAATGTNSIDNTNFGQSWSWNTLTSGVGLQLFSNTTAAASSTQELVRIDLSGTNSNSGETTIGLRLRNRHAGTTSTNIGLQVDAVMVLQIIMP